MKHLKSYKLLENLDMEDHRFKSSSTIPNLDWSMVFNTKLRTSGYSNVFEAFKIAKEYGYEYINWNGLIWDADGQTSIKEVDIK